MQATTHYRSSGAFSPLAFPTVLLVGLPAAMLLATIYAYAILYIPIAGYVTFILSVGFGLLCGVAFGYAMRLGKVRNRTLGIALPLLLGLLAFYAHWAIWVYAFLQRADVDASLVGLFFQPSVLWEIVASINKTGAWELFHSTPTGIVLWLLWTAEALLIVVPCVFGAFAMISAPFCERCGKWCDEEEGVQTLRTTDDNTVKAHAEAKDFAALRALGTADADELHFLRLDIHRCASCDHTNTLSVQRISISKDDKGKESRSTDALVTHLLLTRAELAKLRALSSIEPQALEPAGDELT